MMHKFKGKYIIRSVFLEYYFNLDLLRESIILKLAAVHNYFSLSVFFKIYTLLKITR